MDFWFTERHTPNVRLSIKVDRQLYSAQSEFQRIDIFQSEEFGRFLTLDGYMMLTEKDEFIYHEMMVHVPMCVNPNARDILVIGGGDGGTVRELVRYAGVRRIDLVEIDSFRCSTIVSDTTMNGTSTAPNVCIADMVLAFAR